MRSQPKWGELVTAVAPLAIQWLMNQDTEELFDDNWYVVGLVETKDHVVHMVEQNSKTGTYQCFHGRVRKVTLKTDSAIKAKEWLNKIGGPGSVITQDNI